MVFDFEFLEPRGELAGGVDEEKQLAAVIPGKEVGAVRDDGEVFVPGVVERHGPGNLNAGAGAGAELGARGGVIKSAVDEHGHARASPGVVAQLDCMIGT